MVDGFRTPEEAALSDWNSSYSRVVGIVHGSCVNDFDPEDLDHFEVELATNEPPYEYRYFAHVEPGPDGLWRPGVSHN